MTDQMPLVIFTPSGKRGRFPLGTPVLTAARQLGVDLDSVCGGRGICSKCQVSPSYGDFSKHGVRVADDALSPVNAVEERYDRLRGLKPGRRLGCQATIQGDVVIDVPPESQVHKQVVRKEATARAITMDPATRLCLVQVEEPDMHEPSGDFERLQKALSAQWGIEGLTAPLPVLSRLQPILRKGNWQVTVAIHHDHTGAAPRLIDLWPGFHDGALYGLAIDLGSTTIAAHLCDLVSGEVRASAGIMNPQIRFGEDLMSRVSYVMMNPGGDREMTAAVRQALNDLAASLAAEAGIDARAIVEASFVCNPVMHHLLLGIDPVELGQAPFALATSSSLSLDADALSSFAEAPEALFEMLHSETVLTPHAGEFARLFPDIAEAPAEGPALSREGATRAAAARAGCIVLLKGAHTVIADPGGRCAVNSALYDRAAPWLATAGAGDVLAGFITGLLARGFAPMQAAETAAWLHVECALRFGPGLVAEDLPDMLPQVFRALEV